MKKYLLHHSAIGALRLVASAHGLAGVYFPVHRHLQHDTTWEYDAQHPVLRETGAQLDAYFAGRLREFDLPLDLLSATRFQQEVWQALRTIPYGEVCSYSVLAQQIGRPRAIRAVGAANGRNPLSIVIPCHRVIAANGDLQGYAGGLENKRRLLALELGFTKLTRDFRS